MLTKERKLLIASIRQTVIESVHEALSDPDHGLSLRPDVVGLLKKYAHKSGKGMKTLSDIKKVYQ